jgi:hypothetical protein
MGEFAGVDEAVQQQKQVGQLPTSTSQQPTEPITITPEAKKVMAETVPPFTQALTENQGDVQKLWGVYNNSQYTPEQRQIAGVQLSDMMRQEGEKNKATQFIRSASPEDLNKMLASRSQEGSWAKAIMFGLLGMENSARDEAAKLGVGAKWQSQQVVDPKTGQTSNVLFKVRADGLPMEGYNAETGKALSSKELSGLAAGGQQLDLVGGSYVNDKTGEVGRMVSDKKTGRTYIQTDKGMKPMTGFRPQSSTGTMEDMRARKIQEINLSLQGKTAEEKMRILRSYNETLVGQGIAPVNPTEIGLTAPQIGGGTATTPTVTTPTATTPTATTPTATTPTVTTPTATTPTKVAPVVPTPVTAASDVMGDRTTISATKSPFSTVGQPTTDSGVSSRPTKSQLDAKAKAEADIAKKAAESIAVSADTQNMLNSITKAEKVLESGKHNIGSAASAVVGRGPIAQAVGAQFETTDAKNTKLVLDTVNKLAADGLKVLGSNPSTADLAFWTENKPNGSTDPEVMKEWIKSRSEDMKRRLGYAEKQVGAGGAGGTAPEVPQVYPEKTINGVTYIYDGKGWKKK